jgi:hypothetical protein
MSRYDLTDFEWLAIEPVLPRKSRGVPWVDDRRVLSGIVDALNLQVMSNARILIGLLDVEPNFGMTLRPCLLSGVHSMSCVVSQRGQAMRGIVINHCISLMCFSVLLGVCNGDVCNIHIVNDLLCVFV